MKKINVDQYVMEFSIPVAGDVAILRELPDDKLIGLGAVECRFEKIDTTEEIVARVEEAMKHVDPERLSLNPDCGFAPGLAIDMPPRRTLPQTQERSRSRPPPPRTLRVAASRPVVLIAQMPSGFTFLVGSSLRRTVSSAE